MSQPPGARDVFVKCDETLAFYCPGCKQKHTVAFKWDERNGTLAMGNLVWRWNSSYERPTATPSYLITEMWRDQKRTCHSIITDGQIMFCTDSTHALAGLTVPLEPPPKDA
jgi:hypothetical protein